MYHYYGYVVFYNFDLHNNSSLINLDKQNVNTLDSRFLLLTERVPNVRSVTVPTHIFNPKNHELRYEKDLSR